MRKTFTTIVIMFILVQLRANDTLLFKVNGVTLQVVKVTYIEALVCPKPLSNKFFIEIDYGQENKTFNRKDTRITDYSGNFLEFNSRVSAINFLVDHGYEIYDQHYLFDSGGDISGQRLLLKKM